MNLARLQEIELPLRAVDTDSALAALVAGRDHWDFAVDALLGTGAHGQPEGVIAAGVQALRELDERGTRVVAVDLPTGVDADSGAIARRAVRADLTVTFAAPKRGHFLYPGRAFVGALEVVDIGIDPRALAATATPVQLATAAEMAALLPTRDLAGPRRSSQRRFCRASKSVLAIDSRSSIMSRTDCCAFLFECAHEASERMRSFAAVWFTSKMPT